MKVFLDFEASSLSNSSYPIEVAWVFQDGRSETHLVRPAEDWTDWDAASEAVHGISRDELAANGEPHGEIAMRMIEALSTHELYASAPSWDGKWLSTLLKAAGFARHLLRLRDTDEAFRETATEILQSAVPPSRLDLEVHDVVAKAIAAKAKVPAHRALADAQGEYETWVRVRQDARARVQIQN